MAVSLLATGDLMLLKPMARGKRGAEVEQVLATLRQADLSFVNLETPLTDRGCPADKLVNFRASPSLATDLARAGVTVATVANNHALDYGAEGLLDTLDALKDARIAGIGGGRDLAAALQPTVVERQGQRIALFGPASTLPTGFAAGQGRPGIAPLKVYTKVVIDPMTMDEQPGTSPFVETHALEEDVQTVTDAIRQAAGECDQVLVGIHWGVAKGWVAEHQDYLAQYQQPLGHAFIDAGATAVFGHHPHVVHGVEVYKGRPLFYSLGNFLFHSYAQGRKRQLSRLYPPYSWGSLGTHLTRESFMVRMSLPGTSAELIPTVMDEDGEPVLASPDRAETILQRVAQMSDRFGTAIKVEGGRGFLNW